MSISLGLEEASCAGTGEKTPWWRHFEGIQEPTITFEKYSLQEYLDSAAKLYPKRKAVIFQNYTLTYAQLQKKAEHFAAALRLHGVHHGDRVAIMLPNLPQTMIAVWGVLKAGAVAVMTNPLYMEKELTHHFKDAQCRVLITLDLLWPKIEALYDQLNLRLSIITRVADGLAFPLNILQPWKAKREGSLPEIAYDNKNVLVWSKFIRTRERYSAVVDDPESTLALLLYTGGTTGLSKAAMLTHQNLVSQMQILNYILHVPSGKEFIFLSIMPFFHVFGLVGNIFLPALYGGASIPVPRYTPVDILRTIDKYRANFFIGAPSIYMSLMQQKELPKYDLSCIELCISGSAPFPKEAMARFQKLTGANITEGLGLTEASPCVTANPVYGLQKEGSVGVPLPGTEVRIVDMDDGDIVLGDNERGEIIIRGPQVMQGYWNREDETAQTLRNGWLYTGDIGYRDEDGYYFVVDRKKDMAIVGGYNVYPREVDEVLHEHPKVAEAVTVGIAHRSRGEVIKAFVVPCAGEELTVAELVAFCRGKLANYKVPKYFELRDALPKSLVGKVLRRALRDEEERKAKAAGLLSDNDALPEDFVDEALEENRKAAAQHLRVQAEEMVHEARKKAEEMMQDAKKRAESIMQEAKDAAEKVVEHAKEKAEEMSRFVSQNVDKALKNVRKTPPDNKE